MQHLSSIVAFGLPNHGNDARLYASVDNPCGRSVLERFNIETRTKSGLMTARSRVTWRCLFPNGEFAWNTDVDADPEPKRSLTMLRKCLITCSFESNSSALRSILSRSPSSRIPF